MCYALLPHFGHLSVPSALWDNYGFTFTEEADFQRAGSERSRVGRDSNTNPSHNKVHVLSDGAAQLSYLGGIQMKACYTLESQGSERQRISGH